MAQQLNTSDSRTPGKTVFSRIDGLTLLLYIILVMVGILAVFSVEYHAEDASIFLASKSHMKQLTWLGISVFVGIIILFTDSKAFSSIAFLAYTLGIFLLVITIFAGKNVKGSHSWLGVGGFAFQPGEVCKIFTSLALAKYLSPARNQFSDAETPAGRRRHCPAALFHYHIAKRNGPRPGLLQLYFSNVPGGPA